VNLILLDDNDRVDAGLVTLADGRAAHIRHVLRAAPGRTLRIGRLDGPFGTAVVESIAEEAVTLRCAFEATVPPRPRVDLLLALPRPKVMRRLWAQLAALGVGRIMLTNAERVERPYFDTHVLDETVYRPLLVEGLQQAQDTRLPVVSIHRQFKILIEDHLEGLSDAALRLVADPRGTTPVATAARGTAGRVLLAVGPEGGWNAFELELLQQRGFARAGLGPRTLRADTACTALLAIVHAALVEHDAAAPRG
jgi:RsmE family RNA methyltransferase